MRALLIVGCLAAGSWSFGQFNYFVYNARRILSTYDSLYTVEYVKPGGAQVNTFADSVTTLETILDYTLFRRAKVRKDTLQRSNLLMQLCSLTAKRYSGLDHAKEQRWQSVRKQLMRSFLGSKCRFGMISVYAFRIPLVKTKGDFYYDREGPDGEYNLYDGKKKVKPTEEEPEPTAHRLEYYTELELQALIERRMKSGRCANELRRGLCSCYGYAVSIDPGTLYKGTKVPQAQVIVILGSKRLKLIRRRSRGMS